jgi:tripartite-type tricarboxylate transporter receptor subunit TctC
MTPLRLVFLIAALAFPAMPALADYPDRPLHFIVPYPAGGPADTLARVFGERLAERLGQSVVVENRAGASGNIGMAAAARMPADGYTLVLAPTSNLTVNQSLYKNLSFDVEKDFIPLTMLGFVPNVLVVHSSVPAKTLPELVALAKKEPGKLSFASPAIGSGAHLGGELLKSEAGVDLLHVPYKGIAPATNDLVGGVVSMMFLSVSSALPYIQAGTLRPLALASPERSPSLKDVPTVAEQGFPGFDVTSWYGVVLRAGTPPEIVQRLWRETEEIMKRPDLRARLQGMGIDPGGMPPEKFAEVIRADTRKWGDIVRKAGITAE